MKTEKLIQKFWSQVDKNGPNGCWQWTGLLHRKAYGRFAGTGAHRFSIMLTGQDPTGWHVLHKCNNPKCVNPDHLRLGTNADNMQDKKACGNSHYKFKREFLSSIKPEFEQAKKDRKVTDFARKYGIDRTYCYRAFKNL